jgi:hypothetical protein
MEVTESIPEEEWEESHRERRWVDAEGGKTPARRTALRKMVGKLEKGVGKG